MAGQPWTTVEERTLTAAWSTDTDIAELARSFGRSVEAVRSKALALKLGKRPCANKPWTEADDNELKRIWAEQGSLKVHLHRLPGRTWRSVLERAKRLGLKKRGAALRTTAYSWVDEEIRKALAGGKRMTVTQIAERVPSSRAHIGAMLVRAHGNGLRIAGWGRTSAGSSGALWPLWALGSEPDAPRPVTRTRTEYQRDWRAARRLKGGPINPFATLVQQVAA